MQIVGPVIDGRARCEDVSRSPPRWFGIEHALVMHDDDSVRPMSFAAFEGTKIIGFSSLLQLRFQPFPRAEC